MLHIALLRFRSILRLKERLGSRLYSMGATLLLLLPLLNGCVSSPIESSANTRSILTERVFFKPYDDIWKAIHGVINYPIAVENYDAGVIETEYILASEGWSAPTSQLPTSMGVKFKLIFRLTKGSTEKSTSSIVSIEKEIVKKRDFVSDAEPLPSDKLEELSLLYRVERELQIQNALKQAGLTE